MSQRPSRGRPWPEVMGANQSGVHGRVPRGGRNAGHRTARCLTMGSRGNDRRPRARAMTPEPRDARTLCDETLQIDPAQLRHVPRPGLRRAPELREEVEALLATVAEATASGMPGDRGARERGYGPGRSSGRARRHRPVHIGAVHRRGGHGKRVPGRADPADPAHRGAEADQAGHGLAPGHRPVRGREAGPGADGSPPHRPGARRRDDRRGPALLRHGAGPGAAHHPVLRRTATRRCAPARALHPRLPGRAARAPEGHHPPRPETVERAGGPLRRQAAAQGDRFRRGQGDRRRADRRDDAYGSRLDHRHSGIHESRAGRVRAARRRHAERHLLARRAPLRAAGGHDAAGPAAPEAGDDARAAADHPRRRPAPPEHDGRNAGNRSLPRPGAAATQSRCWRAISTGSS